MLHLFRIEEFRIPSEGPEYLDFDRCLVGDKIKI
jgi:hypothetical protein